MIFFSIFCKSMTFKIRGMVILWFTNADDFLILKTENTKEQYLRAFAVFVQRKLNIQIAFENKMALSGLASAIIICSVLQSQMNHVFFQLQRYR